jgi:SNF2 family DNA or RNA helicase
LNGKNAVNNFMKARKSVMVVLDEATRIKNPSAKRTKALVKMTMKQAAYKRVLTGTPVANSPFDVYAMMKYVDETIWDSIGCKTFTAFKNYFGLWKTNHLNNGRTFPTLLRYRNLDQLKDVITKVSTRVNKEDALDLPDKIYKKHYFNMTGPQSRIYNELKKEFIVEISDDESVAAPQAIVRLTRLHQITSGYVYVEETDSLKDLEGGNPRLDALKEVLEDNTGKIIIFAKFRRDIDKICELLGDKAVRYDGETSVDDKNKAIAEFQHGEKQYFVANPAAAGEGLTLHAANTVIYYNNSFSLTQRLQSEDRAHRIGQSKNVLYIDIVCPHTIDEYIVEKLRTKNTIAAQVIGDDVKEWI